MCARDVEVHHTLPNILHKIPECVRDVERPLPYTSKSALPKMHLKSASTTRFKTRFGALLHMRFRMCFNNAFQDLLQDMPPNALSNALQASKISRFHSFWNQFTNTSEVDQISMTSVSVADSMAEGIRRPCCLFTQDSRLGT